MKKKVEEINILRVIGVFAVIFIHTTAGPVSTLQKGSWLFILFAVLNRSLQFAVPLFIFISGFVLFYNYRYDPRLKVGDFWKKRLKGVLIPYLIWTMIFYGFFILAGYYTFSWSFFFKKLFLADMVYHLYFVLLIIQFYLLFPIFHYLFNKEHAVLMLGILLALNLLFMKFAYFPYADRFFLQYIFFFALGCFFAKNKEQLSVLITGNKYFLGAGYLLITGIFSYQFYLYYALQKTISGFFINVTWLVFTSISIIFAYYAALQISAWGGKRKFMDKIGAASFYIYLSHPLVLMISEKVLRKLGYASLTGGFLFNSAVICLTVIPLSVYYTDYKKGSFRIPRFLGD
ncbi:MAG: acyltransferase [Peptococcaceae bacterium]